MNLTDFLPPETIEPEHIPILIALARLGDALDGTAHLWCEDDQDGVPNWHANLTDLTHGAMRDFIRPGADTARARKNWHYLLAKHEPPQGEFDGPPIVHNWRQAKTPADLQVTSDGVNIHRLWTQVLEALK